MAEKGSPLHDMVEGETSGSGLSTWSRMGANNRRAKQEADAWARQRRPVREKPQAVIPRLSEEDRAELNAAEAKVDAFIAPAMPVLKLLALPVMRPAVSISIACVLGVALQHVTPVITFANPYLHYGTGIVIVGIVLAIYAWVLITTAVFMKVTATVLVRNWRGVLVLATTILVGVGALIALAAA